MAYGDAPRRERRGNLTIYRVPSGRRRAEICHPHEMFVYLLRAVGLAVSLARTNRYDVNHTHFIFPDGIIAYMVARATGLSYIVTAHGSDVPHYNPDRFKLLHVLLRPIWRQVVNNAASIVCPSEYIRELLLKVAPRARSELIPNGIDITRFTPRMDRQRRVLVVSRLFERKGVQFLLHALKDIHHDYDVYIVGDGPYLEDLRRIANDNRVDVKFLGFIGNRTAEFRNLLESSEIFVFTSSAENFPVVLLEAMSAGLSIVTTDDTGCCEVVGDAAVKVPPRNSDAIASALVRLMGDPQLRERLGKAARERVEELFTQRSVSDRYQQLYQRCASQGRHSDAAQEKA